MFRASFLLLGLMVGTVGDPKPSCVRTPDPRPGRAFPTAEGFGALAKGGRGGRVVYVTNLEDYPAGARPIAGSLRWALEELTEPRTILFQVGGNIALTRRLVLEGPGGSYVTIAGQTAPGDGIQLTRWGLVIASGAHDVVVRYLRIRVGWSGPEGAWAKDAVTILSEPQRPTRHVIVDHCSLEWAIDENAGVGDAVENVTFQWCIFAEGAVFGHEHNSANSAGFLTDGPRSIPSDTYLTIHHCYFMNNLYRNPRFSHNGGLAELINNYICNWGHVATDIFPIYERSPRVQIVGNIYARGKSFKKDVLTRPILALAFKGRAVDDATIYVRDNIGDFKLGADDDWDLVGDGDKWHLKAPLPEKQRRQKPWPVEEKYRVTTDPPDVAAQRVLGEVGASYPHWDAVDARLIAEGKGQTGRMGFGPSPQNHDEWPELKGGDPPLDSDRDGMPDAWEKAQGLNPRDPSDGAADPDNDVYTNLEEYLNDLVANPNERQ